MIWVGIGIGVVATILFELVAVTLLLVRLPREFDRNESRDEGTDEPA